MNASHSPRSVVVIGAGPAGLTAALQLTRSGIEPVVFEADDVVGGIARTVERDGWRFDVGGHRFFTKVSAVEEMWRDILPESDWLVRPRRSMILYDGRYYEYPLRALDAFSKLGVVESVRCVMSYLAVRIRPPRDQTTFEGWVTARFGRRLYDRFFRTYTEKVWGVPGSVIQADWAAQRIKSLSLWNAVVDGLRIRRRTENTAIASLIASFDYPRLGPGMLWERCHELVVRGGGEVHLGSEVVELHRSGDDHGPGVEAVVVEGSDGSRRIHRCSSVLSSMPLSQLVAAIRPPPPPDVVAAAAALRYRDFIVVAVVVPESVAFDAQWIYVHTPGVQVGRVQNFAEWSPELVRPGTACLGLEYFVDMTDDLWTAPDDEIIALASSELVTIGLAGPDDVSAAYVVRMPKAYPLYDDLYRSRVDLIRSWLESAVPNVHPVGRNGMHRYNNQDHSMLTAMLAVENIVDDAGHDTWAVNLDDEYHEERYTDLGESSLSGTGHGVESAHADR